MLKARTTPNRAMTMKIGSTEVTPSRAKAVSSAEATAARGSTQDHPPSVIAIGDVAGGQTRITNGRNCDRPINPRSSGLCVVS